MISSDGAAERPTKVVLFVVILWSWWDQDACCIKDRVLVVLKKCPMQIIRSRFVRKIGDSTTGFAILRGIIRRLDFEFANCIRPWTEFIQAPPAEVVAADRDAVYQNLVAEKLAAVDGACKCVTNSAWETRGDTEVTSPDSDWLPTGSVTSTVTTCSSGTRIFSVMCVLKPCFLASKRYVPGGTAIL